MRKFLFKSGLALTLVFCLFSAAFAVEPEDALSPIPEQPSLAVALRVDDLGGFLRWAVSEGNLRIFAPVAGLDDGTIQMITSMLANVPAKAAALSAGITSEMSPFFQAAIAGPDAANVGEFLLGADSPFAPMVEESLKDSGIAFEITDGLLLLGFGPDGVAPAKAAIADESKRLALKRRTQTRDFVMFHNDFAAVEALSLMAAGDDEEKKSVEETFKFVKEIYSAPLEVEIGFESLADRFLVTSVANLRDAMSEKYRARIDDLKPAAGGHIRLFGAGSPMLALGCSLVNLDFIKDHPDVKEGWQEVVEGLKSIGLTEEDMLDVLAGGISIVLGGESVSIEGIGVPAAYLSDEGRNGVAAKILGIVEENAKSLINPVDSSGWDKMYQADSSTSPVPCLVGRSGETIFAGMMEPSALSNEPAPSERLAELLAKESVGSVFVDFEAIRAYLHDVADGPLAAMIPVLGDLAGSPAIGQITDSVKDVLSAKLSVPSVSFYAPDGETFVVDFANVEVPPEDGLWAKLVKAWQAVESLQKNDENASGDENKPEDKKE